ncbi:MAG: replication-associated recombination protein A [Oligoflexia bacterium]|nr:replication-associated recombination protein A [Oligoflexia bacterium]
MSEAADLFPSVSARAATRPLADLLRPSEWADVRGLSAIDKNVLKVLQAGKGKPPSLVLWGPPGTGKTTIAKLIGKTFDCSFVELSAVLSGVKDIREVVEAARHSTKPTLLFVDEIHRFNKAQQDAFLPHIESGAVVFVGATTENPSFYLTAALLSRVRVLVLKPLSVDDLDLIAGHAVKHLGLSLEDGALALLVQSCGGDGRQLLNSIELLAQVLPGPEIKVQAVADFLKNAGARIYDRAGEEHYNVASAFIKSLRGSDPDAALFWGMWMIEHGEDPRFLCRRMMIFASEDVGNADPRALQLAVSTADAFDRLGLPEGRIPIAHCITYLAACPKSNRSYMAMHAAIAAVKQHARVTVPMHLRNAPSKLMKGLGYGEDYQYPHDNEAAFVAGVRYLPDEVGATVFYAPSQQGLEKAIAERLSALRSHSRTEK